MTTEKPYGICCVCGHHLANHIDEGDVWRCHSLGQDAYQCECALRKGRVIGDEPDTIEQYDLQKRIDDEDSGNQGGLRLTEKNIKKLKCSERMKKKYTIEGIVCEVVYPRELSKIISDVETLEADKEILKHNVKDLVDDYEIIDSLISDDKLAIINWKKLFDGYVELRNKNNDAKARLNEIQKWFDAKFKDYCDTNGHNMIFTYEEYIKMKKVLKGEKNG